MIPGLHDMRLLRQTMLGTHDFVSNKIVELLNRGPTTSLEIKSNVEKSAKQMTDEYEWDKIMNNHEFELKSCM